MLPKTNRWETFVAWRPTKGFILRSRRELLHQHVRALHQSRLASRCDLLSNSIRYTYIYIHIISSIYYYLPQSYGINFSAQRVSNMHFLVSPSKISPILFFQTQARWFREEYRPRREKMASSSAWVFFLAMSSEYCPQNRQNARCNGSHGSILLLGGPKLMLWPLPVCSLLALIGILGLDRANGNRCPLMDGKGGCDC